MFSCTRPDNSSRASLGLSKSWALLVQSPIALSGHVSEISPRSSRCRRRRRSSSSSSPLGSPLAELRRRSPARISEGGGEAAAKQTDYHPGFSSMQARTLLGARRRAQRAHRLPVPSLHLSAFGSQAHAPQALPRPPHRLYLGNPLGRARSQWYDCEPSMDPRAVFPRDRAAAVHTAEKSERNS